MSIPMPAVVTRACCWMPIALIVLSACSSHPPRMRGGPDRDPAQPLAEKTVIRALNDVGASESQRLAVLAAFDSDTAERRRLAGESEALRNQIDELSEAQPDYLARVASLAQRRGRLLSEQMMLRARFDQAVAAALTPEQLDHWTAAVRELSMEDRPFGGGGGGGMRRRGGGMGGEFDSAP